MNDIQTQKISTEIALTEGTTTMLQLIANAAKDPAVDVGKMQALLDMHRQLIKDQADKEANEAFARVVKNMPIVRKNGTIDFSSEKKGQQKPIPYAKWEDIQRAIRPVYEVEGFTLSFDSVPMENGWSIWSAILLHNNGNIRKASLPLPLDTSGGKQNIQAMGSTSSYGQRYPTKMLFNLVFEGEDDDGARGGMEFIDLTQCKIINELLAETNSDTTAFFQYMGIAEVANIQRRDYTKAVNALMTKKKQGSKK